MTIANPARPPAAVIALGASAGGVEALQRVVARIPRSVDAAIIVVLHVPTSGYSALPAILTRAGLLHAHHAIDDEPLRAGEIFVAPPGFHVEVLDGRIALSAGPREHGHRPSIDVLFRSVARQCGATGAGIVLSGFLDDGAAGLAAIKSAGGFAAAQDPSDAPFPAMPIAAIRDAHPDVICPADQMYTRLEPWLNGVAFRLPGSADVAASDAGGASDRPPEISKITCPDCGSTLWEGSEPGEAAFRCRLGHAYSPRGLLVGKREALEKALSAAVVTLEERRELDRRIEHQLAPIGQRKSADRYKADFEKAGRQANVLREVLDELLRDPVLEGEGGDDDVTC